MTSPNFISRDPSSGQILREHPSHSFQEMEKKLQHSQAQFRSWRNFNVKGRAVRLQKFAKVLLERKVQMALMITSEMGKPITQSLNEVEKSVAAVRWLCERAEAVLDSESLGSDEANKLHGFLQKDSLGPILGIMPWNFPLWQAIRFVVPTLLSGNVVILKHASNVMGCLQLMTALFREAGIEEGIFEDLAISSEVALKLIDDPRIRGVSLTGSTGAGRAVGAAAGRALKPCLLELGGSDPYLVFADTDIKTAAEKCVQARLVNSGQSCVAGKRFIVHEKIANAFSEEVLGLLSKKVLGDPRGPKTEIGPLAKQDVRKELQKLLEESKKAGHQILSSHLHVPEEGYYISPTLVKGCRAEDAICTEETFGPIMPILTFQTTDQAIQIANHTPFGLGSAMFTRDQEIVKNVSTQLNAGMVFINDFVRSDPRWPFGGVGDSGYGRELGDLGFLSFANLKAVVADDFMKPVFER